MLRGSLLLVSTVSLLAAQTFDPANYAGLRWRDIGPFRGGRTVGAAGIPASPTSSTSASTTAASGRPTTTAAPGNPSSTTSPPAPSAPSPSRRPIPTSSTSAAARDCSGPTSPSATACTSPPTPARPGATSACATASRSPRSSWTRAIPTASSSPCSAIPTGPTPERGVFRSTDGGKTWQKVLYKDENTGAIDLAFDPRNPETVYAVLWAGAAGPVGKRRLQRPRQRPLQIHRWRHHLAAADQRPADVRAEASAASASPSRPATPSACTRWSKRAGKAGGVYRSDDAGANWTRVNTRAAHLGPRQRFRLRPRRSRRTRTSSTSPTPPPIAPTDAGKTFTAIKGAPGGDDYHTIWINPLQPRHHPARRATRAPPSPSTAARPGAPGTTSRPRSSTTSSPTTRFPYWVYGGQQESGSAGVASRGNDGQITFRDWHPVGVEEYGYVAPDPLDPNIIYGGKVTRFNRVTGEVEHVASPRGKYRYLRTAPLLFSHVDPHVLYFGAQRALQDHRWRQELGGHQPRPDPRDLRAARERRRPIAMPPNSRPRAAA